MEEKSNPISILKNIVHYFDLDPELENHDLIHEEIKKGITFKGTNLWILVFAIVVASVGLNMNSTAVIIGAMLISPLMGPINGMGYSIATYNFELFRSSVKNFTFAVFASLIASTTYFALSPISTAHSELLARTSPSIYDVLIALFGGLAGIVAISSRQKGNVIPGVAIATALMPPLCTAGYGLATGQYDFFLGALYLFTINTVFIALAAVVVSQYLKLPIRTIVNEGQKKKVNNIITLVIFIVIVPSIYFGFLLVKKEKFNENAQRYVDNLSMFEGNFLLKSDIDNDRKRITLIYGGLNLTEGQKNAIKQSAISFRLEDADVVIKQGLSLDEISSASKEGLGLREEISRLNQALISKNAELAAAKTNSEFGKVLLGEMKTLFPSVEEVIYAETTTFLAKDNSSKPIAIVVVSIPKNKITPAENAKLVKWLKTRISGKEVEVIVN